MGSLRTCLKTLKANSEHIKFHTLLFHENKKCCTLWNRESP
jgi:hypothetical protein